MSRGLQHLFLEDNSTEYIHAQDFLLKHCLPERISTWSLLICLRKEILPTVVFRLRSLLTLSTSKIDSSEKDIWACSESQDRVLRTSYLCARLIVLSALMRYLQKILRTFSDCRLELMIGFQRPTISLSCCSMSSICLGLWHLLYILLVRSHCMANKRTEIVLHFLSSLI